MWPILTLFLACWTGQPDVVLVTEDAVQSTSASIRRCLVDAAQLRAQGRRTAARDLVLGCYGANFEPMEPALRAHNRRATLSLEYGFGRVASIMGRDGVSETAAIMAQQLADRVESVLDTLPAMPAPAARVAETGAPEE